jgi:hypothetical protein
MEVETIDVAEFERLFPSPYSKKRSAPPTPVATPAPSLPPASTAPAGAPA